jgi:DNA-binding CsgD family transcriptional regulator
LGFLKRPPAEGLESIRHSSYLLRAVATLSRTDAERLLRFVGEAERTGGAQPFTPELLVDLGRLIQADFVIYHETDYVRRRELAYVERRGDEEDVDDSELTDDDWERMNEHPICRRWWKDGRCSPLRLSDVAAMRDFRRTRIYAESWQPWGLKHELKVRLPGPPWHGKTFAFYRTTRRDFTVRDRLVLELLTPHLHRLWKAAATRRKLAHALAELGRADEQVPRGVVFLSAAGEVEFVAPPALRLLRDFFPSTSGTALPAELRAWLESGSSERLLRRRGDRRLVVEKTDDSLILEERSAEVQLTTREREVLGWVARGKTNAEIAELLWLAPSTVRKHLENVYAKLGVSTRTAAVARFLGLVDAQAS